MAALNGGLGGAGLTNGTAGTMDALTQAYSGIQQYAAAALPTLYSQSLLQQQGAAGSQKEGQELNDIRRNLIPPLPFVDLVAKIPTWVCLSYVLSCSGPRVPAGASSAFEQLNSLCFWSVL